MEKSFKTVLITFVKILYCTTCSVFTLFIACHLFVVLANSIISVKNFDFQIILFTFLSILLIIGLWALLFVKIKIYAKFLFFLLLLCVQFKYLDISLFFPSVKKALDMEFCLDTRRCSEGLEVNTEHGKVKINKDNCLKYDWKWDDSRKWCNLNTGSQ